MKFYNSQYRYGEFRMVTNTGMKSLHALAVIMGMTSSERQYRYDEFRTTASTGITSCEWQPVRTGMKFRNTANTGKKSSERQLLQAQ